MTTITLTTNTKRNVWNRNIKSKSIETQTNYEPKLLKPDYIYNKVIIPFARKEKQITNDNEFFFKCKKCNTKQIKFKKDLEQLCRKCFLEKIDREVCKRCKASKKKNEYTICYKCFTELEKSS